MPRDDLTCRNTVDLPYFSSLYYWWKTFVVNAVLKKALFVWTEERDKNTVLPLCDETRQAWTTSIIERPFRKKQ